MYMMANGRNMQMMMETTASIHHSVQVRVRAHGPHLGTMTNAHILTMVARPIGTVPRKRDWTGWFSIATKMPRYTVYRIMEMIVKVTKRAMLRTKMMMAR